MKWKADWTNAKANLTKWWLREGLALCLQAPRAEPGTSLARPIPPDDLYRRIKAAGKGVQAINVEVSEVVPLLDAVGPEGMFVWVDAPDERAAEQLLDAVEQFHPRPERP